MKPIYQTIRDFKAGDCMRACVASIFEWPIENVPNFMEDGPSYYGRKLKKWCDSIGITALEIRFDDKETERLIKDCYVVAIGKSPRSTEENEFQHGIVWHNGKMVHDPHPSGNGISGKPNQYTIFIIKNPAKLIKAPNA